MSGLPSIGGVEAALEALERGQVVLVTPEDEFLYPDGPEDEAVMVAAHDAVRYVGRPAAHTGYGERIVLITPTGGFLFPSAEHEARVAREADAVRVVGVLCRCLKCCCKPGTGHLSHPRPVALQPGEEGDDDADDADEPDEDRPA